MARALTQPSLIADLCSLIALALSRSRSYALRLHSCLQRCFSANAIGGLALSLRYACPLALTLALACSSVMLVLSLSCCAYVSVCVCVRLCVMRLSMRFPLLVCLIAFGNYYYVVAVVVAAVAMACCCCF